MVGITPVLFSQLIDCVDDDLYLMKSLQSHHHSLVKGARIIRAANTFISTKEMLDSSHQKPSSLDWYHRSRFSGQIVR